MEIEKEKEENNSVYTMSNAFTWMYTTLAIWLFC